jgi:hypothetical protein
MQQTIGHLNLSHHRPPPQQVPRIQRLFSSQSPDVKAVVDSNHAVLLLSTFAKQIAS